MSVIINLVILQFLVVFVIDYSGAVDELFTPIVRKITGSRIGRIGKPLSCSLCTFLYTGLIAIAIMKSFTLPYIGLVALLAALTPVTLDIIHFVKDFLQTIVVWLRWITGLDR